MKWINTIIYISVALGSTLAIFMFFRWTGYKGLIAFFLGMGIAVYLFMSKNPMVMGLVKMSSSKEYIEELMKK